nr:unnamed protein product [Digitaria exilis]
MAEHALNFRWGQLECPYHRRQCRATHNHKPRCTSPARPLAAAPTPPHLATLNPPSPPCRLPLPDAPLALRSPAMEHTPNDPETEIKTQLLPCINPREQRGAGATSSPAVYNHPPELEWRRRENKVRRRWSRGQAMDECR